MAESSPELRWQLARDEATPPQLFDLDSSLRRHVGSGAYEGLEFFEVNAKRIVNRVPAASRLPFSYTINAYRGCSHACRYCFARPTHAYLGFGTGEDFDRRIVVKVNAVERTRNELGSSRWRGDTIAMGTNTDPYQAAEGKYHLTQGILGVLGDFGNPFSILTKSTLVLRDLKLLQRAATRTEVSLNFSIGTLDRTLWRLLEPGTPPPDRRVEAVRRLNESGISCGVLLAPVIPGLSDDDEHLEEVAAACRDAGATSVHALALHLRPGVREHFLEFLEANRPDLLGLYRARFSRGAYQHAEVQERIEETVRRVVGDRSDRRDGRRERRLRDRPPGNAPVSATPSSQQLDLFSSANP